MKKLILLALVALVAGAAFAETAPAFSGEFDFYSGFDFAGDQSQFGSSSDATINLNGVVSEWATVNAEITTTSVTSSNEVWVDDGDGVVEVGEMVSTDTTTDLLMQLNNFNLTTDITGALGVDGPIGVAITWGLLSFEPADYSEVAGYEDTGFGKETDSYVGFKTAIGMGSKAKLIAVVWPQTYIDNDLNDGAGTEAAFAVELQLMLVENLSANLYYSVDKSSTADDGAVNEFGFTAAYVTDMVEFGAGFDYQIDGVIRLGVAALANLTEKLALGVAFGVKDMEAFAANTGVALNATFDATDVLQLYGSFGLRNFEDITFVFDAGVAANLAGVTYTLGYDYGGAAFKSPDWDLVEGLYFKVSAAF